MVYVPNFSEKAKIRLILGLLLITGITVFWSLSPRVGAVLSGEDGFLVRFYDVGQGDATLIQEGTTQILIDGGPDGKILGLLGRDLLPWDREIELLVATHPQADHITGLVEVLERYEVQKILYYPSTYDTKTYERFLKAVKNEGAQVLHAASGGQIQVGELLLHIMWPTANFRAQNVNDESIVGVLDYKDFEVLLLGDVEQGVQKRLFSNIDMEVIKMAHHGSWNGVCEPLLQTIAPDLAIISAGANNRYGHPHNQTLALLAKIGLPLLRTDLSGTVTVRSDGSDFWYSTER